MEKKLLGKTGLRIVPLVFGGNVFGWTLNESDSLAMLDAIVDQGLNAIDTADVYSRWVTGNKGGESETIIGNWIKKNPSKRDKILLFTKVGLDMGEGRKGLSKQWIIQEVEHSLKRLQTDVIDLYQSHSPDPSIPYEETLSAYDQLLKQGKVRAIGASNFNAKQLSESLKIAREHHLPAYQMLQPEYNLYDREQFDQDLKELVCREDIGVISYYSLASGFLSGKYRSKEDLSKSPRGEKVAIYMNSKGMRILEILDKVAKHHNVPQSEIALAWLMAQKEITAPIVSATSLEHLKHIVHALQVRLSAQEVTQLDRAGQF